MLRASAGQVEAPSKEKVNEVVKLLGNLVKEAGEEIFKRLDEARKKNK